LVILSVSAACSSQDAGVTGLGQQGSTASCVGVIEIDGVRYIPVGRDAAPVPETGGELRGQALPCADGGDRIAGYQVTAHSVPGVNARDAVAAGGYQLMLAERLWRLPRAQLPPALKPYVSR
jgi:hypothetical protein